MNAPHLRPSTTGYYLAHEGPAQLHGDLPGPCSAIAVRRCAGRAIRIGRRSRSAAAACGCARTRDGSSPSGSSQFGHGFDAWGRYFTTENADHARMSDAAAWLARNPDLRLDSAMARIPDHGAAAQVFPITKRPTFELLTGAGEFTSACAITPYTGGAFPGSERRVLAVRCRTRPQPRAPRRADAVGRHLRRAARRPGREFLAAGDAWFRPVFLSVGADGALYVVDYYRPRIEHPEWTSSDLQKDPSPMYEGRDRGGSTAWSAPTPHRAHRRRRGWVPATDADSVRALESPNLWWRRTAQRLLVDSGDPVCRPSRRCWTDGDHVALAAGAGPRAVDARRPRRARRRVARNRHAGRRAGRARERRPLSPNRASAVRRLSPPGSSAWSTTPMRACASSCSARWARSRRRRPPRPPRRTLLFAHLDDLWMQRAALSAGSAQAPELVDALLARPIAACWRRPSEARAAFVRQLASIVGARQRPDASAARILAAVTPTRAMPTRRGGARPPSTAWLGARKGDAPAPVRPWHARPSASAATARRPCAGCPRRHARPPADCGPRRRRRVAGGGATGDGDRGRGRGRGRRRRRAAPGRRHRPGVARLPRAPRRLAGPPSWRRTSPTSCSSPRWPRSAGFISPGSRPWPGQPTRRRPRSLRTTRSGGSCCHGGPASRPRSWSRAGDVLIDDPDAGAAAGRGAVGGDGPAVEPGLLAEAGPRAAQGSGHPRPGASGARGGCRRAPRRDRAALRGGPRSPWAIPARGAAVFARTCAACHRRGDAPGGDSGPDLAAVRHRPPAGLLADILLPSRLIAQHYETYLVERRNGETDAGLLGGQTATTITLRQAVGGPSPFHAPTSPG